MRAWHLLGVGPRCEQHNTDIQSSRDGGTQKSEAINQQVHVCRELALDWFWSEETGMNSVVSTGTQLVRTDSHHSQTAPT